MNTMEEHLLSAIFLKKAESANTLKKKILLCRSFLEKYDVPEVAATVSTTKQTKILKSSMFFERYVYYGDVEHHARQTISDMIAIELIKSEVINFKQTEDFMRNGIRYEGSLEVCLPYEQMKKD